MKKTKNVLVTGVSGFLGKNIVSELLHQHYKVRVIVRSKETIKHLPWFDLVDVFEGDLRFSKQLSDAFTDIDVLIHSAAATAGDEDFQFESTVVGTERLLDAMVASNTKRLLLISSLSVYSFSGIKELTEESSTEKNLYAREGYAISKLWQERVVREASEKHDWQLTVLRPGMIWGESEKYPLVLSIPVGKLHFIIGPMKNPNLVHVQSCAKAVVAAIRSEASIGETLNIADTNSMNSWRFMGKYLEGSKKQGYRIPVPYFLSLFLVKVIHQLSRWLLSENCRIPSIFIPCRFEARFKPYACVNLKSAKILHLKHQIDLEDFNKLRDTETCKIKK